METLDGELRFHFYWDRTDLGADPGARSRHILWFDEDPLKVEMSDMKLPCRIRDMGREVSYLLFRVLYSKLDSGSEYVRHAIQ